MKLTVRQKMALRLWFIRHYGDFPAMTFVDSWRWLRRGIQSDDLHLRKFCLSHDTGYFKTPQEMLRFIKHGIIPAWLDRANRQSGHQNRVRRRSSPQDRS